MKVQLFFLGIFLVFISCTRKKLNFPIKKPTTISHASNVCQYQSSVVISYSATISPMLMSNCYSCHASPSAFSCDAYQPVKASAQSGNLMLYVANTDTNNPIMPPPPSQHLDSCQIKALTLWISQGCLNN